MEVTIPFLGFPLLEVPDDRLLGEDEILKLVYGHFGGSLTRFRGFSAISCGIAQGSRRAKCCTPEGCSAQDPCFLYKVIYMNSLIGNIT